MKMRPIWPALVSALLGPGAGQIVNGEFKKGILLLAAGFGAFMWFSKVVGERLLLILGGMPEQWQLDPERLKEAVTGLIRESPGFFVLFHLLMFLLWIYSVVDAYLVAKERRKTL